MGISKNMSKPEEKELSVSNTSEIGSEKFYFGVDDSAIALDDLLLSKLRISS